jgi:hypothetical protein
MPAASNLCLSSRITRYIFTGKQRAWLRSTVYLIGLCKPGRRRKTPQNADKATSPVSLRRKQKGVEIQSSAQQSSSALMSTR